MYSPSQDCQEPSTQAPQTKTYSLYLYSGISPAGSLYFYPSTFAPPFLSFTCVAGPVEVTFTIKPPQFKPSKEIELLLNKLTAAHTKTHNELMFIHQQILGIHTTQDFNEPPPINNL